MANRSLVRICAIKQLSGSGRQFHVGRLLMVSGRSSRASLAVLKGGCIFCMGLSFILLVVIVQFLTLTNKVHSIVP